MLALQAPFKAPRPGHDVGTRRGPTRTRTVSPAASPPRDVQRAQLLDRERRRRVRVRGRLEQPRFDRLLERHPVDRVHANARAPGGDATTSASRVPRNRSPAPSPTPQPAGISPRATASS